MSEFSEHVTVKENRKAVEVLSWGTEPCAVDLRPVSIGGNSVELIIPHGFRCITKDHGLPFIAETEVIGGKAYYRFTNKLTGVAGELLDNPTAALGSAHIASANPRHHTGYNGALVIGVTYPALQARIRTRFGLALAPTHATVKAKPCRPKRRTRRVTILDSDSDEEEEEEEEEFLPVRRTSKRIKPMPSEERTEDETRAQTQSNCESAASHHDDFDFDFDLPAHSLDPLPEFEDGTFNPIVLEDITKVFELRKSPQEPPIDALFIGECQVDENLVFKNAFGCLSDDAFLKKISSVEFEECEDDAPCSPGALPDLAELWSHGDCHTQYDNDDEELL